MLHHSFGFEREAKAVDEAIGLVLQSRYRTADLMKEGDDPVGTQAMGQLILKNLQL